MLIVGDNAETARLIARLLKCSGFEVVIAHDGRERIELAREFNLQVILLNPGLPGMNGYEVAASLRQDDRHKSAIIAISGYGDEEARESARGVGFGHHITKPFDFRKWLSIIFGGGDQLNLGRGVDCKPGPRVLPHASSAA